MKDIILKAINENERVMDFINKLATGEKNIKNPIHFDLPSVLVRNHLRDNGMLKWEKKDEDDLFEIIDEVVNEVVVATINRI